LPPCPPSGSHSGRCTDDEVPGPDQGSPLAHLLHARHGRLALPRVPPHVLGEVVRAHEPPQAHVAGELLLARVRALVTRELVRTREGASALGPLAEERFLARVRADVRLEVTRLEVGLVTAGVGAAVGALPVYGRSSRDGVGRRHPRQDRSRDLYHLEQLRRSPAGRQRQEREEGAGPGRDGDGASRGRRRRRGGRRRGGGGLGGGGAVAVRPEDDGLARRRRGGGCGEDGGCREDGGGKEMVDVR